MSSDTPKIVITSAAVIACIVHNPEEYSPNLRAMWENILVDLPRQGIDLPRPYPDSTLHPCQECGVRVCVGPRELAKYHDLITQGAKVVIACMLCGTILAHRAGATESCVVSLGNPAHDK